MMKNLILNWRASVQKDALNENKIMHEATDEEIEVLSDVLSNLDPENLPLNGAFGGKLRKVIPLEAVGGKVGDLVNTLEDGGYTVNLKDGTASYETRREHEGKVYKGKKTLKINKILNGLLKHKEKERDVDEKMFAARAKYYTERSKSGAGEEVEGEYEQAMQDWDEEKARLKEVGKKAFRGMDRWVHIRNLVKYIKAWEENAGFFKNDPAALSGFSIILSRHPADVLRMSDFDNITSCHTLSSRSREQGSFIKCAYAEAIDGGAIAYVVPTEEIRDWEAENDQPIEDTDEEVLSDSARGIGDIEPVSRIRVRVGRFDDDDRRWYIGVPDARIYGANTSNFYETLKAWLVDNQEGTIQHLPKVLEKDVGETDPGMRYRYTERDVGKVDAGKMTLVGGRHQDNPLEQILARMLDPEAKRSGDYAGDQLVVGNPRKESSEDDVDVPSNRYQQVEEEIEALVDYYNDRYEYCTIYGDVEDYGDGPTINAYAALSFDLDVGNWSPEYTGGDDGKLSEDGVYLLNGDRDADRDAYGESIVQDFYDIGGLMWAEPRGEEMYRAIAFYSEHAGAIRLQVDLRPGPALGDGYIYDSQTFEEFADAIESDIEDKVDPWLKVMMKRTLIREGILEASPFQEFMKQAEEEEFEDFEDTDWSFDVIMDENRVDIDISVEFKIDEIQGLEDVFYTDQAIKDIGMSRNFAATFKKMLFDQVPGFVYEESMYPKFTRRYVSTYGSSANRVPNLGLSFTVDGNDPPEVLPPTMSMIEHIKKKDVEEIAKQAYNAVVRKGTAPLVTRYSDSARQQALPFGDKKPEPEPESEKSLNERIHRNWSGFLNSK